jgi:response regulator RpfG family c-di-GMP phosphodiesterase
MWGKGSECVLEKILIVDDNVMNCDMIADVLRQVGYEVFEAHQGKEVLPMIRKNKPSLVLLDVMLPGMNGFEICKRIKDSPETENIAVILLTVLNGVEDRTHAINVGADLFLSKPVNHKELKRQIEFTLLNKSKILNMENARSVCQCFLKLTKYLNSDLYQHTLITQNYSIKTAQMMGLDEQMILQVEMGAALHDLGKMLTDDKDYWKNAKEVLMPLRMIEWIEPYLDLGQKNRNNGSNVIPDPLQKREIEGVEIVRMVNRFAELCQQFEKQKEALAALLKEIDMQGGNTLIYRSLEQVIIDEVFVREFKAG